MADDFEGAIPDDQEQEQSAAPESGQPAIPEPEQEQPATLGGDRPWYAQDNGMLPINAARSGASAVAGGAKRILHYLMGADSADPAEAERAAQNVKAQHPNISDDEANVLAVHQATEMGGPAAGWAMIQYNRSAYDRKQAFAKAALNGVDGKAGDLQAAANAASQASQNILDGSQATFTADPGGNGVTATVKAPGSNQTENYTLTPEQFDKYLDIGGAGQWDHVMSNGGISGTLQKIVGTTKEGKPSSSLVDLSAPVGDTTKFEPDEITKQNMKRDFVDLSGGDNDYTDWNNRLNGKNPDGFTLVGRGVSSSTRGVDDADVRGRAMSLFPSVSQNAARNQYLASETTRGDELDNKRQIAEGQERARLGVAREAAGARVKSAETSAGARVKSAQIRSEAETKRLQGQTNLALTKMMQQTRDGRMREMGRMLRAKLLDPNFANLPSEQQDAIVGQVDKFTTGIAGPGGQIPQPGGTGAQPTQNAPAQGGHQVPPANERVVGQVYQTPKGPFKWMGNGWQRAE